MQRYVGRGFDSCRHEVGSLQLLFLNRLNIYIDIYVALVIVFRQFITVNGIYCFVNKIFYSNNKDDYDDNRITVIPVRIIT